MTLLRIMLQVEDDVPISMPGIHNQTFHLFSELVIRMFILRVVSAGCGWGTNWCARDRRSDVSFLSSAVSRTGESGIDMRLVFKRRFVLVTDGQTHASFRRFHRSSALPTPVMTFKMCHLLEACLCP